MAAGPSDRRPYSPIIVRVNTLTNTLYIVGRQFEPYRWRPCGVILWPGMLFPNSRGNKAAANLRL